MELAQQGLSREAVLAKLSDLRDQDADRRGGRLFSLLYPAGEALDHLLHEVADLFLMTNALNPTAFPSLRQMEAEVVGMTAALLGDPDANGTLTSGGTESILLSVKAARDRARGALGITMPQMLLPETAHPAFEKAAHLLGVAPIRIPVREDLRADAKAARSLATAQTILIVGSAPCYPFGVIDPIDELAALAAERGIFCHVDACLGGYLLPFLRELGEPIPPFDFSVPGVTSMSADLHKYGYATKGVSCILYRDAELRREQFFVSENWSGGLYASPTMAGSRAGAPIASAWATMQYLGREGYAGLAGKVRNASHRVCKGIDSIDGLKVLGQPDMSVIAFGSDSLDLYALADAMDARGWHLDRQQRPTSLHLMLSPAHEPLVDSLLADLAEAAHSLREGKPAPEGQAAMYGMLGASPDRDEVRGFLLDVLDGLYRPGT